MTLKQMVSFEPSALDMAMLPLDVTVYVKCAVVSLAKEDNYAFLRYFFLTEDLDQDFKNLSDTVFYDFDGRETRQERFVTVFEAYSFHNYASISERVREILEGYSHECDVIFDFYTHDDKKYRLSNLDGIVKLEEIPSKDA